VWIRNSFSTESICWPNETRNWANYFQVGPAILVTHHGIAYSKSCPETEYLFEV